MAKDSLIVVDAAEVCESPPELRRWYRDRDSAQRDIDRQWVSLRDLHRTKREAMLLRVEDHPVAIVWRGAK